jgi:hypothetical protein
VYPEVDQCYREMKLKAKHVSSQKNWERYCYMAETLQSRDGDSLILQKNRQRLRHTTSCKYVAQTTEKTTQINVLDQRASEWPIHGVNSNRMKNEEINIEQKLTLNFQFRSFVLQINTLIN